MLDTIRGHFATAFWFLTRLAIMCLMIVGVYGAYRLVCALPEGNAAQGKTKLRLLDYERDTQPQAPQVIVIRDRDDRTPPVATASCNNTACAPHPSCPCENAPTPQQLPGQVQIVSISTMPGTTASVAAAPAPRPTVNPNPAPKPLETTCGGR